MHGIPAFHPPNVTSPDHQQGGSRDFIPQRSPVPTASCSPGRVAQPAVKPLVHGGFGLSSPKRHRSRTVSGAGSMDFIPQRSPAPTAGCSPGRVAQPTVKPLVHGHSAFHPPNVTDPGPSAGRGRWISSPKRHWTGTRQRGRSRDFIPQRSPVHVARGAGFQGAMAKNSSKVMNQARSLHPKVIRSPKKT